MQNHSNETSGTVSVNDKCEFAGFWVRLAAYAIDTAVITVGLLAVRLVFIGINSLIAGSVLEGGILFHYTLKDIVLYLLQVLYFILFTYHTGTTPGKKALNLKVIQSDGTDKLSLITVIYRETIGRFLCGFILFIGYFLVGIDKEKRGLHDILCDTRVIYAKKVKVYPEYQKDYMRQVANSKNENVEEPVSDGNVVSKEEYIPRMIERDSVERESIINETQVQEQTYNYTRMEVKTQTYDRTVQDDIAEQWKQILNPEKETKPRNEEQNIEGNP